RCDLVGDADAKVVEFNANCPGGVLFTGAYDRLWRAVPQVRQVLESWAVAPSVLSRRHWFPEFLLAATGNQAGDADLTGPVAIFHKPGGNVLELTKMVALLGEIGWPAFVTDPAARDWRYEV